MASFKVKLISIAPITGTHLGSGKFNDSWTVAGPASVDRTIGTPLDPIPSQTMFASYLFEVEPRIVPWRFGAVCVANPTRFDAANIFFHPNPTARHGYHDADYPDAGAWPGLYKYMTIIGAQIGISDSSQIFIMPYFTSASITGGLGMFPENWSKIVRDIVQLIRNDIKGLAEPNTDIKDIIVSSYSYGITAATVFRKKATTIKPFLREVWDFDGYYSITERHNSISLIKTAEYGVLQYSQHLIPGHKIFHVPQERWTKFALRPPRPQDMPDMVHHAIAERLFLHAFARSVIH
jgi:hypothetical protein